MRDLKLLPAVNYGNICSGAGSDESMMDTDGLGTLVGLKPVSWPSRYGYLDQRGEDLS